MNRGSKGDDRTTSAAPNPVTSSHRSRVDLKRPGRFTHHLTEQQLADIYKRLDSRSPNPPEISDMLQDKLEAHRNAATPTDPDTIAAVRLSLVLGVARRWGYTPNA